MDQKIYAALIAGNWIDDNLGGCTQCAIEELEETDLSEFNRLLVASGISGKELLDTLLEDQSEYAKALYVDHGGLFQVKHHTDAFTAHALNETCVIDGPSVRIGFDICFEYKFTHLAKAYKLSIFQDEIAKRMAYAQIPSDLLSRPIKVYYLGPCDGDFEWGLMICTAKSVDTDGFQLEIVLNVSENEHVQVIRKDLRPGRFDEDWESDSRITSIPRLKRKFDRERETVDEFGKPTEYTEQDMLMLHPPVQIQF